MPKYTIKGRFPVAIQKTIVPGPGAYEIHCNNRREAPRFGFGSSTRKPAKGTQDTPGPGSYKVNVKIGETPQYALPNKSEEFKYV